MTAFARMTASLHADPNLGTAAQYRRPPGIWASLRVILSNPKDEFGNTVASATEAWVAAADLTDAPQKGDELRVNGLTYTVETPTAEPLRDQWRLKLSRPKPVT